MVNRIEKLKFADQIKATEVHPPVFVLGHYRSGTTHLHNLLAQDHRLGAPTFYQTIFPYSFLLTEEANAPLASFFLPKTRSFDNVSQHFAMAQEDEFSMCVMNGLSPYMSWSFPRRSEHYDRFLTFHDADLDERNRWKADFQWLLKKLTFRHQRPLLLKSPPHTARIRMILELFPNAKFVHIHRDPYVVYQSTVRLYERGPMAVRLQVPNSDTGDERILKQYAEMHDAYFEDVRKVPAENLCLVRFDELERDPVGELQRVYETIGLPDFAMCEKAMKAYLESIITKLSDQKCMASKCTKQATKEVIKMLN